MNKPRFFAEGGTMQVGRRVASHAWGTWSVTIPYDMEEDEEAQYQLNAYTAPLDDGEHDGILDRAFIRADADMDMNEGISNFEENLDEAARRAGGDVFFDREIPAAGLGRQVPFVDFKKGDMAEVTIWGKVLDALITQIRLLTNERVVDWSVHVGTGLLWDEAGLRRTEQEFMRALRKESEERKREEARIKEQAATDRVQTQRIDSTVRMVEGQAKTLENQQGQIVDWAEVLRQTTNSMLEILRVVRGLSWTMRDAGQGIISAGQGDESTAVGIGGAVVENAQNSITALNRLPVPEPIPEIEMEDK